MANFQWAIDLAKQLLHENGETESGMVLYTPNPDNPTKPWEPGEPIETTEPVDSVWLNPTASDYQTKYVPEEETVTEVWKVLVPAKGLTAYPKLQGYIKRESGDVFKIHKMRTLSPAGQPIMFTLYVYR